MGCTMALTNDAMTAANAVPMTTAIARSTTLPRMMNSLNPLSIRPPAAIRFDGIVRPVAASLGRHYHRCELLSRAVTGNPYRSRAIHRDHEFGVRGVRRREHGEHHDVLGDRGDVPRFGRSAGERIDRSVGRQQVYSVAGPDQIDGMRVAQRHR